MPYGVRSVGSLGINAITWLGGIGIMFGRFLLSLKDIAKSGRLIIEQCYTLGVRSLPLVIVISIFTGAVAAWQAAYQFQFIQVPPKFLGYGVGKAVVMELGPVLSALVIAGRVGAGITAELGTMKVTEQIDALTSMGINPVRYLVMPRLLACLIMVPLLVVFADTIAILGGLVVTVIGVGVSAETFLNGFHESFRMFDFVAGLIKATVFGLIIGLIGCYEGFNATQGAEGVGLATTVSVVLSCVMILVFNFIFAILLFRI